MNRFLTLFAILALLLAPAGCAGPLRQQFDTYARTGDWARAEQDLRTAMQTHPDDPELAYLLGRVYGRQARFDEMARAFEASLSMSTRYAAEIDRYRDIFALEQRNHGVELYDRGEYEAAIRQLREIGTIRKGETRHLPVLGLCYAALDRTDEAERVLRRSAEVDADPTALAELVRLESLAGDTPAVIEFSRRLLDRDPDRLDILPALAAAYETEGKDAEAVETYRKILEAEPENRAALHDLARILARLGRPAEAVPVVEALVRLEPNDPAHRFTRCALLYDAERFEEALGCFEAYEAARPGDPETIEYLFVLNRALGHRDEARRLRDRLRAAGHADPPTADPRDGQDQ